MVSSRSAANLDVCVLMYLARATELCRGWSWSTREWPSLALDAARQRRACLRRSGSDATAFFLGLVQLQLRHPVLLGLSTLSCIVTSSSPASSSRGFFSPSMIGNSPRAQPASCQRSITKCYVEHITLSGSVSLLFLPTAFLTSCDITRAQNREPGRYRRATRSSPPSILASSRPRPRWPRWRRRSSGPRRPTTRWASGIIELLMRRAPGS